MAKVKQKPKHKFTLKGTQFRVSTLELKQDVLIDGTLEKAYPVGWVKLRGMEDPVFQKSIAPFLLEYREDVKLAREAVLESRKVREEDEKDKEKVEGSELDDAEAEVATLRDDVAELIEELMINQAICSIVEWDEDFFQEPFSTEAARQVFTDPSNNHFYNQIVEWVGERTHFLPSTSEQL